MRNKKKTTRQEVQPQEVQPKEPKTIPVHVTAAERPPQEPRTISVKVIEEPREPRTISVRVIKNPQETRTITVPVKVIEEPKAESESEDLWSTAYHEAGHAVVNWRLGIGLRKKGVTIVPDEAGGSLGSCAPRRIIGRDIEWNDSDRNCMRVEKKVQCLLAGEIAQRR